jgi:allantoate deiminase
VRRLACREPHRRSLDWFASRLESAGLTAGLDAAGNLIGRWETGEGPAVLVGSHLDTGPDNGRYDGSLGVLGALAAVELLQSRGVQPRRPIWIASFMDEEGVRFGASMMGSRAFIGDDVYPLLGLTDEDGVSMAEAMRAWDLDPRRVGEARAIDAVGTYLELHVEQGPRLEAAGIDVGIVTGIAGMLQARVRLTGEANHAGTTPMDMRRDALMGAAALALALRDDALAFGDATLTVGSLGVEPGAFTVIPHTAELTVDFRCGPDEDFARLRSLVARTAERIAENERLAVSVEFTDMDPPVALDPTLIDELERSARAEGASSRRMASGAGHDAMLIAKHVPTGMVFVPSRGGISHSPDEFTEPEHCELGVRVLARTLETLVS